MILDRRINKEQQEKQLSTNLARVFVLYITPPKVQNEDPVNIDQKALEKGSGVNFYRGRNKEQKDKWLSTNLTRVFVLYITPTKVQNGDPVNIDRSSSHSRHSDTGQDFNIIPTEVGKHLQNAFS